MEERHPDFAPYLKRRYSFRDRQIAKNAISANLNLFFFQNTYILDNYMIYVTSFKSKNILRESSLKKKYCTSAKKKVSLPDVARHSLPTKPFKDYRIFGS